MSKFRISNQADQPVTLNPKHRRQLGFLQGTVGEEFFEPLPADELERLENLAFGGSGFSLFEDLALLR